jgi:hypothetical protein
MGGSVFGMRLRRWSPNARPPERDLPETAPELNWGYLTHHLNQDYLHGEQSGLCGVTELFPGEEIVFRPATLRLFSEDSTGRFWFDVGSKHVLFVSEETFDPSIGQNLTVDTCGNSQPLSKAAGLLVRWVGLLGRPCSVGSEGPRPF